MPVYMPQIRSALFFFFSGVVPVRLWANASSGGDHYVTQMDPNGTVRDFIDYDANLIACATGVATTDRCTALLGRVDKGRCAHAKATFVSEVRGLAPGA
jgi:hypothetical protein